MVGRDRWGSGEGEVKKGGRFRIFSMMIDGSRVMVNEASVMEDRIIA